MAKIKTSTKESMIPIKKWLGVNENVDGDTHLKLGEASEMTNFKITNDYLLQIRPGTQDVANLLFSYAINDGTPVAVSVEINVSTATYTLYPSADITAAGILYLLGATVVATAATAATYANKYWEHPSGSKYKLNSCVYTPATGGTAVDGGTVEFSETITDLSIWGTEYLCDSYASVQLRAGAVVCSGAVTWSLGNANAQGKYVKFNGFVYLVTSVSVFGEGWMRLYGKKVTKLQDDTWTWNFYPVTIVPNTSDSVVQGIWSGRVGTAEVMCAACNGRMWALTEANGVWTKTSVGTIDTTNRVHFFGFDGKLYILNGVSYKVWDGETLSTVAGYRPLTAIAVPPAGGGVLKQRINMLNGLRRVQFSPDGTSTVFKLPETALTSVDYVKNMETGVNYTLTTHYTVNTTLGTVTFVTAPADGEDTIEVAYTFPTTLRAQIEAMCLSELFNGIMDNRVFVYGDGTNKAFYSDLDDVGTPTPEYFPDLNVIHVGESNTPITSMLRHQNRLLAFKEDSAYSIRYDPITLDTGVLTAGFYCTPVNKTIGGIGSGQAVVVENYPRTLDGRSIYEWQPTSADGNITGDQRNANKISQKVEKTLKSVDIKTATSFFDKINHEYFVVQNGIAIVQNTENASWYIYRDFPAECMIVYKDNLYYGTANGNLRHVSRDYMHDCGIEITAYWESGSMDFGADYMRKYSDLVLVGIKPESKGMIKVTVQTDQQAEYDDPTVLANYTGEVDSGFFSFLDLDFEHFSFNVNNKPQMMPLKIKVKNFTFYKLIFSSVSKTTTATITSADIKVRYVGTVR